MTSSSDNKISPFKGIPYPINSGTFLQTSTANNLRPLPPLGHLVNEGFADSTQSLGRDFVKDVKNIGKGLKGDLNDNDLGRLNDIGMKLGGLLIAGYLAAKKALPLEKAMEFIGFGTFFASMSLWPKLMIEKPVEWMHGVNINKKYVDSYGRKKKFFIDPQYVPWDLYTHDEIEKLGDKMGISKDLANRQDIIKETAQKKAVQANTLWMWTAGFATPLMTGVVCTGIEPYINSLIEKKKIKNAKKQLSDIAEFPQRAVNNKRKMAFEELLSSLEGKELSDELAHKILLTIAPIDRDTKYKCLADDLSSILFKPANSSVKLNWKKLFRVCAQSSDGQRANYDTVVKKLARLETIKGSVGEAERAISEFVYNNRNSSEETMLANFDRQNLAKIIPESSVSRVKRMMQTAFREAREANLQGLEFVENISSRFRPLIAATSCKNLESILIKELKSIFKSSKKTTVSKRSIEDVSDRIYSALENLLYRGVLTKEEVIDLNSLIKNSIRSELSKEKNPRTIKSGDIARLKRIYKALENVDAQNIIMHQYHNTLVGDSKDNVIAYHWKKTMNNLVWDMDFRERELGAIQQGYPYDRGVRTAQQTIEAGIDRVTSSNRKYRTLIRNLAKNIAEYDRNLSAQLLNDTFKNYEQIFNASATKLRSIDFARTAELYTGDSARKAMKKFKQSIFQALGISDREYNRLVMYHNYTPEKVLRRCYSRLMRDPAESEKALEKIRRVLRNYSAERVPLAEAIRRNWGTLETPSRKLLDITLENIPYELLFRELSASDSQIIEGTAFQYFKKRIGKANYDTIMRVLKDCRELQAKIDRTSGFSEEYKAEEQFLKQTLGEKEFKKLINSFNDENNFQTALKKILDRYASLGRKELKQRIEHLKSCSEIDGALKSLFASEYASPETEKALLETYQSGDIKKLLEELHDKGNSNIQQIFSQVQETAAKRRSEKADAQKFLSQKSTMFLNNQKMSIDDLIRSLTSSLKEDATFVQNLPEFIDSVLFRINSVYEFMIYQRGLNHLVPEWSEKTGIPKVADMAYNKTIKAVREMFLDNNGTRKNWSRINPYFTSLLGDRNDLAGTALNNAKIAFAERQMGARACFYRTLQTFDIAKRMKDGIFAKQCKALIEYKFGEQYKHLSPEAKDKLVAQLVDDCRQIILSCDIAEHSEKFDINKIYRNGADYYKLVMSALYETSMHDETATAMTRCDKNLYRNFKRYCTAVLEQVGNDASRFMPDSHMGNPLMRQGNPMKKHLLIARNSIQQIKKAVVDYNGGHRWFRLFGTMFAGLIGVTLFADAVLLRTKEPAVKQDVKGNENDKFALSA